MVGPFGLARTYAGPEDACDAAGSAHDVWEARLFGGKRGAGLRRMVWSMKGCFALPAPNSVER